MLEIQTLRSKNFGLKITALNLLSCFAMCGTFS